MEQFIWPIDMTPRGTIIPDKSGALLQSLEPFNFLD